MIIIGLDVGMSLPGIAVIDTGHDVIDTGQLIWGEAVKTKALTKKQRKKDLVYKSVDDARRMIMVSDAIARVVAKYRPELAVLELPSGGGKNSNAVKGMAIGATIAVVSFQRLDVKMEYVTAHASKLSTADERFAEKEDVFMQVRARFPDYDSWPRLKRKDAYDMNQCFAIADACSAALTWIDRQ
jgi:Holliday junction resolvasome RuvABC endonuclease subunit